MAEHTRESAVEAAFERVQAAVGKVATRHHLGPVGKVAAARFAVACDTPPTLLDEDGLPGGRVPNLYLSSVLGWDAGRHEAELRLDGTGGDVLTDLPLTGLRLMGVGQELTFGRPVLPDTDVLMEMSIDAVERKEGRSGVLLLVTVLRRLVDAASGEELVSCRERFVGR
ncbi:MAG: hypothetical protein GEU93_04535 [Propionibacteriales bacterium]|nr:hypothetical protein [Propionibacteriales bacterium]